MKRILGATNYPNLDGLGLYYTDIETARSFINGKTFSRELDLNGYISLLLLDNYLKKN